jgi:hypothetical protein
MLQRSPRTKSFLFTLLVGGVGGVVVEFRVFKKMWYVISKCLNTHGRNGSKLRVLIIQPKWY